MAHALLGSRAMNRSSTLFRTTLFVLSLSACGLPWTEEEVDCTAVLCGACPPAVTLRVSGASGQPVPDATLGAGQGSCSRDVDVAVCNPSKSGAGRYEFDVQAPGYQSVHVVEDVATVKSTGCCACGYESRVVDVRLVPE